MNPLDYLTGGAQSATNAVLDTAAARPFNVILTIDQETRAWATSLVLFVGVAVVVAKLAGK